MVSKHTARLLAAAVMGALLGFGSTQLFGSPIADPNSDGPGAPVLPIEVREVVENLCDGGSPLPVGQQSAGCKGPRHQIVLSLDSKVGSVKVDAFYGLTEQRIEFCLFEYRISTGNDDGTSFSFHGLTRGTWFIGPGERPIASVSANAASAVELVTILNEFRVRLSSTVIKNGAYPDCLAKPVRRGGGPQMLTKQGDPKFD
jgi:hypothetical protein